MCTQEHSANAKVKTDKDKGENNCVYVYKLLTFSSKIYNNKTKLENTQ